VNGSPGPGPAADGPVTVTVPALLDGVRVDRAVALLTGVSRARATELVASGAVRLDGRVVMARQTPLTGGAALEIDLPPDAPVGLDAEPDVEPGVLHADDDVIVVDKPAGLVVHPGAGRAHGTLAAGLLARFGDLADLPAAGFGDPLRPGIVHRLDRGTSGLLVVARSPRAFESLTEQLAERTVGRRYVALVHGHVAEARGVVEAPIGRAVRQPTKMTVSMGGRAATTAYEVLTRGSGAEPTTLLALRLETGRTHQIRVHMAAIGHPVVGDERYGRPDAALGRGRHFLHAARLAFEHPADGPVAWRSPLPADLAARLDDVPEELLAPAGRDA